jgi:CheY-like chemotaxis protein
MVAGNGVCPPSAAAGPHRVLVVEDHPDGRESLCEVLRILGFEVRAAADGPSGVAEALAWRPECAVVDLGLPGFDGCEVARRVRAGLGGAVRLVAWTGYSQPEDAARARAAGFDACLLKPTEPEEILASLRGP